MARRATPPARAKPAVDSGGRAGLSSAGRVRACPPPPPLPPRLARAARPAAGGLSEGEAGAHPRLRPRAPRLPPPRARGPGGRRAGPAPAPGPPPPLPFPLLCPALSPRRYNQAAVLAHAI